MGLTNIPGEASGTATDAAARKLFRVRIESKSGSEVRDVVALDDADAVRAGKYLAAFESDLPEDAFTVTLVGQAAKTDLTQGVKSLATIRAAHNAFREMLRLKREAFDAENAELIARVKDLAESQSAAEEVVRGFALAVYEQEKEKKPTPGIEIKIFKAFSIDVDAGLEWAREKQLCLVPESLDVAAVKKMAAVTPLPFVTIKEEPKVQIATDLAKALPAGEHVTGLVDQLRQDIDKGSALIAQMQQDLQAGRDEVTP